MEGRTANRVGSSDLLSLWGRAYGFDAGGNRTEMVHFDGSTTETTDYEYNDFNQLTITDGPEGVWGYAYDDAGNLTYVYDDLVLNPAEFQHNRENRLVAWTQSEASMVGDGQKTAEYVYDAFGRLLWRKGSDGTESRHYYDGINELLVREKPQAGSWRTRYVQALAQSDIGQVLARRTATGWSGGGVPSTWTDRYYHYDLRGNTVIETDSQGEIVVYVEADSFGNAVSGSTDRTRIAAVSYDLDMDAYLVGTRWYAASRGLFMEQNSPYTASGQNPVGMSARAPLDGGAPSIADGIQSNCTPRPDATMPWGGKPPQDGANCGKSCFEYRRDHYNVPSGDAPPVFKNPYFVPSDGSLIDYVHPLNSRPRHPDNSSHVGFMVGGCVLNCHGERIRYYDPASPTIPGGSGFPVSVDVYVWPAPSKRPPLSLPGKPWFEF